jgi:hypothetical protein
MREGAASGSGRRVAGDWEPVLLAVVLGAAAVIPVAWILGEGTSRFRIEEVGWHPLGTRQVLLLALGSVLSASLVGGAAGAIAWRRRRTLAPVVAITAAWFVGIVALPVAAALFDVPLRAGVVCLDACEALLADTNPLGGVAAYGQALLGTLVVFPLLTIPIALGIAARRLRRRALWIATGVAAHAVANVSTTVEEPAIYAMLVAGVLVWTSWLWARDGRVIVHGLPTPSWGVVLLPVVVAVAVTGTVTAASWTPDVPEHVSETDVGTGELHGLNPPDPSEWFPSIVVPRTPEGSGCFDSVVRAAGRLELCWEGYRDNRETLPGADKYHFRLVATLHATGSASWVTFTIHVPGAHPAAIGHVWPSGVLDGPCRTMRVEGMNFYTDGDLTNDVVDDIACGRTTSATAQSSTSHRVVWTCSRCGADAPEGRAIAIREIVSMPEGVVPTWVVSAELGR